MNKFLAVLLAIIYPVACLAADNTSDGNSLSIPAGTMILPLSPKLDVPAVIPAATNKTPNVDKSEDTNSDSPTLSSTVTDEVQPQSTLEKVAAEQGSVNTDNFGDDADKIDEKTTLKGTIQIVADDTEFDQNKNTFLGTGNAVALIGRQNSKLQADSILYHQNNQMIDAR